LNKSKRQTINLERGEVSTEGWFKQSDVKIVDEHDLQLIDLKKKEYIALLTEEKKRSNLKVLKPAMKKTGSMIMGLAGKKEEDNKETSVQKHNRRYSENYSLLLSDLSLNSSNSLIHLPIASQRYFFSPPPVRNLWSKACGFVDLAPNS